MTNPNSHNTGADENPLSPEAVPASSAETPKSALERIAALQRQLKQDAEKLASENPDTGRKTESASEKAAEADSDSAESESKDDSTTESSSPEPEEVEPTWGFHNEAPKAWYRKAWEFFTFGGATQLSAEELFGSRANQKALLKVRKAMSKGTILPAIATAGKTLEGGLTGLAVGKVEMLAAENALNAALVYGGGIGSNILAPIGGAGLLPIASLGARRLYAWNRYEQAVNDKYEETKNDQLKIVDGVSKVENRDFADQDTEQKFLNDQERVKNESHHKSPVDTIEEKDFIQLMAKHARCSPPEVPYLQSADRYAKYCFVKFTEACKELNNRKDLTERQKQITRKYLLENDDEETKKQSEMLDVMKSLWEVSVEYGKLLAYEHKKARDASLVAQSFGSAIMATPFLGAAPLAVAGLFTGARKFYLSRVKPKNIEFDEHGRLRVRINPLLEEEGVDNPKSLYSQIVFKRELGETQITDAHKYWMDKMSFENVQDVSSERELAGRLEEDAFRQLQGSQLFAKKASNEDIDAARHEYDDEKKKLEELMGKKNQAEKTKKQVQAWRREKMAIVNDPIYKPDQRKTAQGQADTFAREISDADDEIATLEAKISGEDGQEMVTKKAYEKWQKLRNPAKAISLRDDLNMLIADEYPASDEEKKMADDIASEKRSHEEMRKERLKAKDTDPVPTTKEEKKVNDECLLLKRRKSRLEEQRKKDGVSTISEQEIKLDTEIKEKESSLEALKSMRRKKSIDSPAEKKAKDGYEKKEKQLMALVQARKKQLEIAFKTIREAFAKKVKDKWKEMEGQKTPGMRKAAGQAVKNMAKNSRKTLAEKGVELAVEVIKPVAGVALAYGALNLVGAGSVVSGVSTFLSPTVVFSVAAMLGGYKFLKKRVDGVADWALGKLTPKESAPKPDKPAAESTSKAKDTSAK